MHGLFFISVFQKNGETKIYKNAGLTDIYAYLSIKSFEKNPKWFSLVH